MKPLLIAIAALLFSCHAQSQTRYYHYDNKKLKLSAQNYEKYVVPQARNFVKDFYFILNKSSSLKENRLTLLRTSLYNLQEHYYELEKGCKKSFGSKCLEKLNRFYIENSSFEKELLTTHLNILKDISRHTNYLANLRLIKKLQKVSYSTSHSIELALISNSNKTLTRTINKIPPLLHESEFLIQELFNSFLPYHLQEPFNLAFSSIISKLEAALYIKKTPEFFLDRVEEVNLAWNNFHMRLSKGHRKIDQSTERKMRIMHNRWNSILKLIL